MRLAPQSEGPSTVAKPLRRALARSGPAEAAPKREGGQPLSAALPDDQLACRLSQSPSSFRLSPDTCDALPEAIYRLKPGYLKIYEVEERDGWIWVSDTPKPPPSEDQPSGEAPAVFRVTPRPATTTPAKPPQAVVHPVEEVVLRLDEEFELEIPTTPVPGHMWRLELSSDRVRIVGQQYDSAGQPLTRVRAVGQEAGRVTLRCLYARPWGQSVREIRTYQIEVTH